MQDVGIQMLVLGSQNAQHQTGAQVNILIFIFMYSLKCQKRNHLLEAICSIRLDVSTFREIDRVSYLYLIVGLNELLKAHLLFQIEAKFFQTTEDAVMIRRLCALVLPTAICSRIYYFS